MAWLKKRGSMYYLCYLNGTKEVREALHTDKFKVADDARKRFDAKRIDEPHFSPKRKNPTCAEFWETYSGWLKNNRARRTLESKKYFWDYLIEHTGAVRLADISPDVFAQHVQWHRDQGRSDETLRDCITVIRCVFNWAIKHDMFTGKNPTRRECKPAASTVQKQKRPTILSPEDIKKLLTETKGDLRLCVLLGACQGLRKHEISLFRMEWVDCENKMIRIGADELAEGETLKTGKRSVPLADIVAKALPDRSTGYLFEPKRYVNGNSIYRVDFKRGLVAALERAGLPTESPYQSLRIAFGNALFRNGESIDVIAQWMGNSPGVLRNWYLGSTEYRKSVNIL